MTWLFSIFDWFANNKTARLVLMVLAILIGIRSYGAWKASQGAKRNQEKHDKQQLEEQAEVLETRRELSQEREDARQRADEAVRDLPEFSHPRELRNARPGSYDRLFGDD